MNIITVRSQIRDVAERWRGVYLKGRGKRAKWYDADKEAIYHKLAALDTETATTADVAAVIGNDTWISDPLRCYQCGKMHRALVVIEWTEGGDDLGIGYRICADCLRQAATAVAAVERGEP